MAEPIHKNQIDACYDEVFGLLLNYWSFRRRINRVSQRGRSALPEDDIEEVAFLESMERDIVMGLCRLDDEEAGIFSFRHLHNELVAKERKAERINQINRAEKDYRRLINSAKTQLRNKYIAHLSKRHDGAFTSPEEFEPMVKGAVDTLDAFAGKRLEYAIPDKNSDFNLNLRTALGV